MTLIVLTVVVIACYIVALAVYLFVIGALLDRTADGLGDCLQNLQIISGQAQSIGPGVKRINKTGEDLVAAMPLLLEGAEGVAAKLAPVTQPSAGYQDPAPKSGMGYLDV